jgi:hypothetical protein
VCFHLPSAICNLPSLQRPNLATCKGNKVLALMDWFPLTHLGQTSLALCHLPFA